MEAARHPSAFPSSHCAHWARKCSGLFLASGGVSMSGHTAQQSRVDTFLASWFGKWNFLALGLIPEENSERQSRKSWKCSPRRWESSLHLTLVEWMSFEGSSSRERPLLSLVHERWSLVWWELLGREFTCSAFFWILHVIAFFPSSCLLLNTAQHKSFGKIMILNYKSFGKDNDFELPTNRTSTVSIININHNINTKVNFTFRDNWLSSCDFSLTEVISYMLLMSYDILGRTQES